MEPMRILAHEISEMLAYIDALWENTPKRPPVDNLLALSETPISLKLPRRYGLLFLSKPIDLLIDMCGIGKFPLSLQVGWNDVSFPEGTTIALASDGSLSALYRCSDTLP
jgi:hypothetical protein